MKQSKLHLNELIEKYKNTSLLSELESNLRKELSEDVSINLLEMNPICLKYHFRKDELSPLEITMSEQGVLEPLLVRKKNGKYQVITGLKTYFLAKKNKYSSLPVIVKDVSDDLLLIMIVHRLKTQSNENVLNKAYIYDSILKLYPLTRNELASLVDISISQVTNTLRLLKLSECVKKALRENKIAYGHARMLVGLSDEQQEYYLNRIINDKLSVRDIEQEIFFNKNEDKKNSNDLVKYKCKYKIAKDGKRIILDFDSTDLATNFLNNLKK